jgi:hypothetical protein
MLRRAVWYEFTNVSEVRTAFIIALMMEAASSSSTPVSFYQTARRNIPEDSHHHTRHRENPKYRQQICLPLKLFCSRADFYSRLYQLSVISHEKVKSNNIRRRGSLAVFFLVILSVCYLPFLSV